MTSNKHDKRASYTPALGLHALTPLYDWTIALLTRERLWRSRLANLLALTSGLRLLDVGCGTGSLAVLLAKHFPAAEISGIDPDPHVLEIAKQKALRCGVRVAFHEGFLTAGIVERLGPFDVMTSSLVFHQVPSEEKLHILQTMRAGLRPCGRLCMADYGLQRTTLTRFLFRSTVQMLDGTEDTQLNAEGLLPALMAEAGFSNASEIDVIPTLTGSISIYTASRTG